MSLTNPDLAPTEPHQRTWSMWHIAALWVGMAVCIPTYTLASGLVDKGWSWQAAVLSVTLGNLVVLIPMVLNAHPGTRYGIPFPVLVRSSFGVIGANVPALLRAVVACGWFGIQTYIGGQAIYVALQAVFGLSAGDKMPILGIAFGELLCVLVFWAVQVIIILRGMESIRVLESASAPFLIAIGLALLAWAFVKVDAPKDLFAARADVTHTGLFAVLGAGLTSAVSFWGTLALNIPDFARYARSQREQIIGQAIGLPTTMAMFAFIGAVVTNATVVIFGTRIADPVALLGRIGGAGTTVLAMAALLIATLTTNLAANVVSPANDFANVAPDRIDFKKGALITAVIGLLMMPWRLYNDAGAYLFTWLLGYGAMLGAVGGIMIADYFFLRKLTLHVDDLYRRGGQYEFYRGFNVRAMVALVAGIVPNVPGFVRALVSAGGATLAPNVFDTIYTYAWFVGFFVSALVYLVLMRGRVTSTNAAG